MPFDRDPQGGGTNADGTKNTTYCSHCYQRGAFTLPDITAEQMSARVRQKLLEAGLPDAVASSLSSGVPKLARWSS
jgi:hypothetical protein